MIQKKLSNNQILDNIHKHEWRLQHLYYIRNKKAQTIPFKLNWAQKQLLLSKSRNNMVLKARQLGVSTYYLLKYLDLTMFNRNFTCGIIAHSRESLEKLFRVIKFGYEKFSMPEIKPPLARGGGSKYEFYFPSINSRIYVSLEVRSESINALHVSEYGLMKNKDRYNASVDAVPIDGEISIESTPFGTNHFHDDWVDPENPFVKHFFPWFGHKENMVNNLPKEKIVRTPEEKALQKKADKFGVVLNDRQIAWRRFKIKQKGRSSFLEEHPEDDITCFLLSGEAVMDLELLSLLKDKCLPAIKAPNKHIKIFKERIPGHTYVIGADTAEGLVGKDYSAAVVLDKNTREQVATLRGHMKPKVFAEKLVELAGYYKSTQDFEPQLAVERNNHGHAVILWLEEELNYPNLFTHNDDRVGWKTNSVTRPIMLDTFIDAVEEQEVKIYDPVIINEAMKLIDNNGKTEAMEGHHDDAVIATSIALQLCLEGTSFLERMME